ncbi:epoxide hydrolase 2-like isoform X2 [Amblyomma americanum]
MVPPFIGKLMVLAIGTSMWIWMQAYVKVQITLHGRSILTPKNRTEPAEFKNETYGNHTYQNLTNITVHYMKKGCNDNDNRTMLVLLHGFLDFWFIWNRQIAALGEEFCVVAPDLRGYGLTTRPADSADYLMKKLVEDVRELIDALKCERKGEVVLVGHDWGGMIAFCFATLYEHMIHKMVIINGMHPMAFSKQLLKSVKQMRMSWYMLPFRHPVVPEEYLIMNDLEFFDKVHKGFTADEEYAHKYVFAKEGALTGAINYYRAFNNDTDQLKKFPYRKINVTTLILWGVKDAFLTTPVAKYNRKWLNSSTVVYYRGAGHWLLRECSIEVTEQIRSFTTTGKRWRLHTMPRQYVEACTDCAPPGESWLSTLLPWLPRDSNVPTFNGE